jgi:hypothetical protein
MAEARLLLIIPKFHMRGSKWGATPSKIRRVFSMTKHRGNPNWGKPDQSGPVVHLPSSFEQIVKEFNLTPDQYVASARLREWARLNRNSKYIPEALLKEWGFEVDSPV